MTPLELGFVIVVIVLLGALAYFAQDFARELPAARAVPKLPAPTPEARREPEPEPASEKAAEKASEPEAAKAPEAEPASASEPEPEPEPAKASEPEPEPEPEPEKAAEADEASSPEPKPEPAAATSKSGAALFAPPSLFDPPSKSGSLFDIPKPSAPSKPIAPVVPKVEAPVVPKVEFPKVDAPVAMPVDKPKVDAGVLAKKEEEDEGSRYRRGLLKTRKGFISRLANLFRGKPKVDDDLKDDVEEVLFTADIGAKTAEKLLAKVTEVLDRKDVADAEAVWGVIEASILELVDMSAEPLDFEPAQKPYVMLMIGVNGVGKTTTIGKLASRHAAAGRKVLLVAGDTFRAAAVEQLEVWSQRVGCDIHKGADGADPSSVIFDGIARAKKEGYDVVLCDTAGRLHTRKELMDELQKIRRSAVKALSKGSDGEIEPHDIFLVLDATIGQNALSQAQLFKETMNFSGLVLTKLDGTAKGGVVLGICDELGVPIRYIGIGEGIDDLRDFDAKTFTEALLARPDAEA